MALGSWGTAEARRLDRRNCRCITSTSSSIKFLFHFCRAQPSTFCHSLTSCAFGRPLRATRSSPASAGPLLAMAAIAIPPAQRKKILKVLFISLLLDLVNWLSTSINSVADSHRYLLHSYFLYSRNSSSSTAILKHLPRVPTPSLVAYYLGSTHIRTPFHALSTIATTSFSWAVHSDPYFPSSKPSHPQSSAPSPINMGVDEHCCGQWPAI